MEICDDCLKKIFQDAETKGKCIICGKEFICPQGPAYVLCGKCSNLNRKCRQCGKEILKKTIYRITK